MDQSLVPLTFHCEKILDSMEIRVVNIKTSMNDTIRTKCTMAVTISGKVLTPLLVFKSEHGGGSDHINFSYSMKTKFVPDRAMP